MNTIVCALTAEAAPLIEILGLKKEKGHPFALYRNGPCSLIVSGMGNLSAAAATAYILTETPTLQRGRICNFGIAGAANRKIGELFEIRKVVHHATGKVFHLPASLGLPKATLTACENPCGGDTGIKTDLADMESAGFLTAARRFVSLEDIHILKIVSDPLQPDLLTKEAIASLIAPHLSTLKEVL